MSSRLHRPSDTRLQIIRAAGDLFHRRGVESTSDDEIIEAVGVGEAEFHQHFKSKSELVQVVLRYHIEGLAAGTGLLKYDVRTWWDLEECLASHVEFQKLFRMTRGCPIGRLGSELREENDLVRHSLNHALDLMVTRLECFLSREKREGRLANDVDVEQLANFCVAVIQGAMLTGKIRRNCRSVESTFKDLLSHLKRYARIPAVPRKRLARDRYSKQLTTPAKAPASTTLVKLHECQNPGDSLENRFVDLMSPVFEVRKEIPDEGTPKN